MATGNYGTVRPADVSVDDIEILYSFSPNRSQDTQVDLLNLDPAQVLVPVNTPNNNKEILGWNVYFKITD